MLISEIKFNGYRQTFYEKVVKSPYQVTMKIVTATTGNSFQDFVGDSSRTEVSYQFPCLYEKIVNQRQREKYGLPDTTEGIIYLSPLQLVPVIGTFVLDKNKTTFIFEYRPQVIDNITYLESLYGSCVGLQIAVKDSLKGG